MRLAPVLASLTLAACAADERAAATTSDALIGGDGDVVHVAVGAFVTGGRSFCTGTLVSPRVVVTAKHCTENLPADAVFAFGPDARAPLRVVAIDRFERATPDSGGFMRKGSDVAGVVLAEPVLDVTPIPVAPRALDASDLNRRFTALGYGVQGTSAARDVRKSGDITLLALDGAPIPLRYPTLARFLDAATDHYDHDLGTFEVEDLTVKYGRKLLTGYEAFLSDPAVQTCHGDSGGPILRKTATGYEVVAVVSGGTFPATFAHPGLCAGGNVVAIVTAPARTMLDRLQGASRTIVTTP